MHFSHDIIAHFNKEECTAPWNNVPPFLDLSDESRIDFGSRWNLTESFFSTFDRGIHAGESLQQCGIIDIGGKIAYK